MFKTIFTPLWILNIFFFKMTLVVKNNTFEVFLARPSPSTVLSHLFIKRENTRVF